MRLEPLKIGDLTAKIPIIQGGMGVGISLSSLAGAVAAAGGIGVLSAAQIGFRYEGFDKDPIQTNLKAIQFELEKARKIAKDGILGINIMVATQKYEEYVKAATKAGVDLIISGAGLPMKLPELVEGAKTKIAPIVSSVKSAQVIMKYWLKKYSRLPDLVVIEGPKAGGHLGFSYDQLQNIDDEQYDQEITKIIEYVNLCASEKGTKIPVAVAGGMYTREDAERVFQLGASAVQMATRFVTTHECDAPMEYKQAYINANQEDIVLVQSPVGMPGRAIRNTFLNKTKEGKIPHGKCHCCVSTCNPQETPYCITEALVNAAKGETENALLFCGTNAYRAHHLETVEEIMQEFA